jgi:hypothetical protein
MSQVELVSRQAGDPSKPDDRLVPRRIELGCLGVRGPALGATMFPEEVHVGDADVMGSTVGLARG